VAEVHLPRSLVALFPGTPRRLQARGATVAEVIADLDAQVPGIRNRLLDAGPSIRTHLNIFVSGQRATLATAVPGDAVVHVIPAVSGGAMGREPMNEVTIPPADGPKAPRAAGRPEAGAFDDPRALTILNTEHWSLMSARGLVYNEAFARAGMFLAFLSATLVALGLVATATGFSDGFLIVAAAVLALDLFVGLASLGRIAAASGEDIRYLQGTVHGLTTTPGMIGVICSAVAGALAAVAALLLAHDAGTAAVAGLVAFAAVFVILNFLVIVQVRRGMRELRAMFPRTDWDEG
jgi:molybdopterin converting factor small subunit